MNTPCQTEEYKGYTINIFFDEYPDNPREGDNLGIMQCFHKKYNLGDKHIVDSKDYNSWNEMEHDLIKNFDAAVILPIYMYDHSGVTVSTKPFSCPWDSGRLGLIFVTRDALLKKYNMKKLSKKVLETAKKELESEVEIYDQYLGGDVYGFKIKDLDGNEIDSGWGFYGNEGIENIINEAKNEIDKILLLDKEEERPTKGQKEMEINGQLSLAL
jgi:hypothetical protein